MGETPRTPSERYSERYPERYERPQRSDPRLDERLDRWVSAGRQLVDGVSGARPGSRGGGKPRSGASLQTLGRWVEDKIDWLLEDDEQWREPWESAPQRRDVSPAARPMGPPEVPSGSARKPLQAISRRVAPQPQRQSQPEPRSAAAQDWPDDDAFQLSRWRRGEAPPSAELTSEWPSERPPEPPQPGGARRALPRSSRRRSD
jgi:hypothetical protein